MYGNFIDRIVTKAMNEKEQKYQIWQESSIYLFCLLIPTKANVFNCIVRKAKNEKNCCIFLSKKTRKKDILCSYFSYFKIVTVLVSSLSRVAKLWPQDKSYVTRCVCVSILDIGNVSTARLRVWVEWLNTLELIV